MVAANQVLALASFGTNLILATASAQRDGERLFEGDAMA
jgi:hypothetical protein